MGSTCPRSLGDTLKGLTLNGEESREFVLGVNVTFLIAPVFNDISWASPQAVLMNLYLKS